MNKTRIETPAGLPSSFGPIINSTQTAIPTGFPYLPGPTMNVTQIETNIGLPIGQIQITENLQATNSTGLYCLPSSMINYPMQIMPNTQTTMPIGLPGMNRQNQNSFQSNRHD